MARLLTFVVVVVLSSNSAAVLASAAAESINKSEIDRQALLSFKAAGISSDPLGVLHTWRYQSLHFCSWRGVTCGKALPLRVVSLNLSSLQLAGELPRSLANLTSLARLDLGNNSFSGAIPEELCTLPKLQNLMLANNSLSGEIPLGLFKGSSPLVDVILERNILTGSIPDFHNMSTLQTLDIAENNLTGTIPPSIGNVSSLTEILLDANSLVGFIPETLCRIQNLTVLSLYYNHLSGYVPAKLYNISSLSFLFLSQNYLHGRIPSSIGNTLPNLQGLVMSGNRIKGSIPTSLTKASNLIVIDLSDNALSGPVPSLANASKLAEIDLSNNALSGPMPFLGSLPDLFLLDLGGNNLLESDIWPFITSLTNCSNLVVLSMHGNSLSGTLPASIGNLSSNLNRLDLGNNQIGGTIPKQIGSLIKLQLLAIDQNSISGEIPISIGNLEQLVILSLSQNGLSSQIPSAIGNLLQLSRLSLDSNNLRGKIPESFGQFKQLTMLNLSVNNLDGYIPPQLLTITTLLSLDLANNNLAGSIPQQIGSLINLVILNISYNRLSGQIPPSFGQCLVLSSLHMESNHLDGFIPQSFINLRAIQQIDLSKNNLTGRIPDFFNRFAALEALDLSCNNFWGPIPIGGVFQNAEAVIIEGNEGLCANNETTFASVFPICPRISTSGNGTNKNAHLLLIIILPIAFALFSLLCFMVTLTKKTAHTTPCYKEMTMKKVSYGEILKATNWFSPINKISSSRTGSVYIGRFVSDTDLVAIKVFHLDENGSLNSFHMECKVLRNTRHRNLMKAVTLCSTVDMENNEFKAIVFDFMANGSLDMWVHPKLHENSPKRALSMGQRMRIAMDVAFALDYMHNQLTPSLIHSDLKPANVLLDYDMTARVGDFGSAKFLSSGLDSPEGFVGIGGTIGYIAPEYGMGCKLSTGCDVYSFGVLLLEMLTGMRPTDAMFINGMHLHKLVLRAGTMDQDPIRHSNIIQ